ncbi:hypothetical protein ACFWIQ_10025 [Kitasatospora sp. NPDC127059]|uniref:hypothetical protein n=1 Tax=unclassified Kitasatospora TaxID=2633591 RepID=UPI0036486DF2
MVPVHLTLVLTGPRPPTEDVAHALEDILWAHARPETALEHLRVRADSTAIGIVCYLRAATTETARARARLLVADALAASGIGLDGCTVTLRC